MTALMYKLLRNSYRAYLKNGASGVLHINKRQLNCSKGLLNQVETNSQISSTVQSKLSVQKHHELKQEVERFNPTVSIESAKTPPGSWYTNKDFLTLEKESVLSSNWIAVGHTEQLKSIGQYITGTIADEPFIVTRDQNNQLQAFYNICRHHATLILEKPCGNALQFVCPYHGWTYALDGRLSKANRLKTIQDFKARNYGLKSIDIATWGPVVFLKLDKSGGQNLHDKLSSLKINLDEMGFDSGMKWVKQKTFDLKCNWKVLVENFLDGGYHVEYCHKDLNNLLQENTYKTELYDGFSIQKTLSAGERLGNHALFAHIYPNLMINRYGNWLDMNYVIPVDQESCKVVYDWFISEDSYNKIAENVRGEQIEKDIAASCKVQDEDTEICERVQKGLRSRSYEWGRYAPLVEIAAHQFHIKLYKDYMRSLVGK